MRFDLQQCARKYLEILLFEGQLAFYAPQLCKADMVDTVRR